MKPLTERLREKASRDPELMTVADAHISVALQLDEALTIVGVDDATGEAICRAVLFGHTYDHQDSVPVNELSEGIEIQSDQGLWHEVVHVHIFTLNDKEWANVVVRAKEGLVTWHNAPSAGVHCVARWNDEQPDCETCFDPVLPDVGHKHGAQRVHQWSRITPDTETACGVRRHPGVLVAVQPDAVTCPACKTMNDAISKAAQTDRDEVLRRAREEAADDCPTCCKSLHLDRLLALLEEQRVKDEPLFISEKRIEEALIPLCDVLDPEEGSVIIAFGVKQLAKRVAENLNEVPSTDVATPEEGDAVTHRCPPERSGMMPCCGRTPFEVSEDRMTADDALVTWKPEMVAVDVHGYVVEDDTDPLFDRWVPDGSAAVPEKPKREGVCVRYEDGKEPRVVRLGDKSLEDLQDSPVEPELEKTLSEKLKTTAQDLIRFDTSDEAYIRPDGGFQLERVVRDHFDSEPQRRLRSASWWAYCASKDSTRADFEHFDRRQRFILFGDAGTPDQWMEDAEQL